ncbi:GerMN domain-containing protein [Actinomarinicola tropica]|uniref:GerMN domain-containing protein n=1 Tax=Actinomarinicola tropica TaxID=2789776 RepID=A0A5Q2RGW6_9ACTN|nr:GerMN domain-containing protein [Actinomarinicola tropica]QGG93771.1 hypothetical protein GH723_00835 [Actinomarinicola tropica]
MRIPRSLLQLLVACALVLGLAACGDDDGGDGDGASATTAPDTSTTNVDEGTTSSTDADDDDHDDGDAAEPVPLSVYFLDGEEKIRVGHVRMVTEVGVGAAVMESLLEGPTAEDEALGLSSAIPDGTTLRSIDVGGGVATVDLSEEYTTGGGSLSMQARLAQVVYTLTQFPTVDEVEILVEGSPLEVLGGEGVLVDGPLTRADFQFDSTYEWLEPMILVEAPRPGEVVPGDVVLVGGSSNTFEAAVYIEILDADGEVVVPETYTMATAGTGTTGTFEQPIELPADAPDQLVVRAYDVSAEDGGGRLGVTEVPFRRS